MGSSSTVTKLSTCTRGMMGLIRANIYTLSERLDAGRGQGQRKQCWSHIDLKINWRYRSRILHGWGRNMFLHALRGDLYQPNHLRQPCLSFCSWSLSCSELHPSLGSEGNSIRPLPLNGLDLEVIGKQHSEARGSVVNAPKGSSTDNLKWLCDRKPEIGLRLANAQYDFRCHWLCWSDAGNDALSERWCTRNHDYYWDT